MRRFLLPAAIILVLLGSIAAFVAAQVGNGGKNEPEPSAPPEPLRYATEYPAIDYSTARLSDPVAQLQTRIARGEVELRFDADRGYLDALLEALRIDPSSQVLVFSQTSLQGTRIRPERPRAIYFNDDVYVAWVQQGPIEIASMDPNLGPVFYMLEQDQTAPAPFQRELTRCLSCHDSYSLTGGGVPRFIVGSGYTGPAGTLITHEGWILVTDQTPLRSRWGGWYVTGRHGDQVHLGNMVIRAFEDFERLDELRIGNIDNLDALFDTRPYLTNKSDVVALMLLEHQVNVQNLITRVRYDTLTALHAENERDDGAAVSSAALKLIDDSVEPLVQALFFVGEAQLTGTITGDAVFARQFASRAMRDERGRSLRDLDLSKRMFRYPLSYLVYSAAFDALPDATKEVVYRRIGEVLSGADRSEEFAHISAADRTAIAEILADTKPELAAVLED
ncbi:MAG TPA: hypothetical protein VJA26_18205 [Gammaproteobacteria bacterium]|nr:hypothetical protein [Gammaproteobacteria bacterium]